MPNTVSALFFFHLMLSHQEPGTEARNGGACAADGQHGRQWSEAILDPAAMLGSWGSSGTKPGPLSDGSAGSRRSGSHVHLQFSTPGAGLFQGSGAMRTRDEKLRPSACHEEFQRWVGPHSRLVVGDSLDVSQPLTPNDLSQYGRWAYDAGRLSSTGAAVHVLVVTPQWASLPQRTTATISILAA